MSFDGIYWTEDADLELRVAGFLAPFVMSPEK